MGRSDDGGLQDLRHLRQDPRNGRKRRQPHPPRQEGRRSSVEHLRRMTTIWPPMTAFFYHLRRMIKPFGLGIHNEMDIEFPMSGINKAESGDDDLIEYYVSISEDGEN